MKNAKFPNSETSYLNGIIHQVLVSKITNNFKIKHVMLVFPNGKVNTHANTPSGFCVFNRLLLSI